MYSSAVSLSRHPNRPAALWFAERLLDEAQELRGDRAGCDDPALYAAVGFFATSPVMLIAHRRAPTGTTPATLRKAQRMLRLACRFQLPMITLIEEPGRYPSDVALWPLVGQTMQAFLQAPTPLIAVLCGEAVSGGAIALCAADAVLALQNSYVAAVTPEAVAAILWHDASQSREAEKLLRLTSSDAKEFGLCTQIIPEGPGAHLDPTFALEALRKSLEQEIFRMRAQPLLRLVEQRKRRYQNLANQW